MAKFASPLALSRYFSNASSKCPVLLSFLLIDNEAFLAMFGKIQL
jgi:hypothetical protein